MGRGNRPGWDLRQNASETVEEPGGVPKTLALSKLNKNSKKENNMDFSQMNELYLVNRYEVGKGRCNLVGMFRGKENADAYVNANENSNYEFYITKVATDM